MKHSIQTVQQAREYLESIVAKLSGACLELAKIPMGDKRFWLVPGSSGTNSRHHCFDGGNAVHTAQVMMSALGILEGIDFKFDGLVVAVLWHDYGKVFDYQWEGERFAYAEVTDGKPVRYQTTSHYRTIKHLSGSCLMLEAAVAKNGWKPGLDVGFIQHLILSHHGRLEWGSPVEPQCCEAWALHAADMMSSQFAGVDR